MAAVSDEEFLKLYEMAEKAEQENCFAASMLLENFKKIRNIYNYQLAYLFGLRLRQMDIDGKTVFLTFRKYSPSPIITWRLVPYGYQAALGRANWRQKEYLEFQHDGTSKKIIY
jgi:hypothetical protein